MLNLVRGFQLQKLTIQIQIQYGRSRVSSVQPALGYTVSVIIILMSITCLFPFMFGLTILAVETRQVPVDCRQPIWFQGSTWDRNGHICTQANSRFLP